MAVRNQGLRRKLKTTRGRAAAHLKRAHRALRKANKLQAKVKKTRKAKRA